MLLNMVLGGDLAKAVAQGQTSSEHAQLCILLQVLAVIIVKSVVRGCHLPYGTVPLYLAYLMIRCHNHSVEEGVAQ